MTSLPHWPRSRFSDQGGDPYVFWVLFGQLRPLQLDVNSYRSHGAPQGVVYKKLPANHPDVPRFVLADTWGSILAQDFPGVLAAVKAAPECVIIEGTIADAGDLCYLRDLIGLTTCLFDRGATALVDVLAYKWWTKDAFQKQLFFPRRAMPFQHISILQTPQSDGLVWLHTRGMRLFGRPDVSMHGVRPEDVGAVAEILNRFIGAFSQGAVVEDREEFSLELLPGRAVCELRGDLEDPLFHNVHLEVLRT